MERRMRTDSALSLGRIVQGLEIVNGHGVLSLGGDDEIGLEEQVERLRGGGKEGPREREERRKGGRNRGSEGGR